MVNRLKKSTRKFIGVIFAGITFAFSFLIVSGVNELFELNLLDPIWKIFVGAGLVVILGWLANKYNWLK